MKKSLPEKYQKRPESSLATAILSATLATLMCYPLDTVRRQMQMKGSPYKSVLDAFPGELWCFCRKLFLCSGHLCYLPIGTRVATASATYLHVYNLKLIKFDNFSFSVFHEIYLWKTQLNLKTSTFYSRWLIWSIFWSAVDNIWFFVSLEFLSDPSLTITYFMALCSSKLSNLVNSSFSSLGKSWGHKEEPTHLRSFNKLMTFFNSWFV